MLKKYNPLDDSILAQLRQHMLEGKAVHLHNTFRGLPVRNNGIIRMVSQAFLAIDTQPEQCVCLLNEKRTIITGKFLATPLRGRIMDINTSQSSIMVSTLNTYESSLDSVTTPHLLPPEPIFCEIKLPIGMVKVELKEIIIENKHSSLVKLAHPNRLPLAPGEEVILAFSIPGTNYPAIVPATLLHKVAPRGLTPVWKYQFGISLAAPTMRPMREYLVSLQKQIKNDLAHLAVQIQKTN